MTSQQVGQLQHTSRSQYMGAVYTISPCYKGLCFQPMLQRTVLSAHATKDCAFSTCYKGLWFQHMLQRTVLSAHATKDYAFSQCYRKTKKGNEGDQFWCTSYKDIHTPWNWVVLLPAQRYRALVQCLLFCLLTNSSITLNNSANKFLCGYNVHLEKPPHLVIQCNFATFKADQEQHILHYNGA